MILAHYYFPSVINGLNDPAGNSRPNMSACSSIFYVIFGHSLFRCHFICVFMTCFGLARKAVMENRTWLYMQ